MVCMSEKVACVLICFAGNLELFSLYIGCEFPLTFLHHSLFVFSPDPFCVVNFNEYFLMNCEATITSKFESVSIFVRQGLRSLSYLQAFSWAQCF